MPRTKCLCIEQLSTVIDSQLKGRGRSARIKEDNRLRKEMLTQLGIELLGDNFDEIEVNRLVGELGELGTPRNDVQTVILSRLAFNEALCTVRNAMKWCECRAKWFKAGERFGIADWAMGQAIEFGQSVRAPLRGPLAEVEKEICDTFFNGHRVLREIRPKPGQE